MMTDGPSISVYVPSALRRYCDGSTDLELSAGSVRAALLQLRQRYPSVYQGVCDETGAVRRHVNLFVNTSHVVGDQGLDAPLAPGDVLTILPAVSGG